MVDGENAFPKAELVNLWFFAGLTTVQAAHVLGVSATTAKPDWAYIRWWLRLEMGSGNFGNS